MGSLSKEYYDNLLNQNQVDPAQAPQPVPVKDDVVVTRDPVETNVNVPQADYINQPKPLTVPGGTPTVEGTTEEQILDIVKDEDVSVGKQIKKFGGEVGSEEYYRYKAAHPYRGFLGQAIGSTFGLRFPDQETWDKMTFSDRAQYTASVAPVAAARLAKELPREVIKAPIRVALSVAAPWQDLAQGKTGTLESVGERPAVVLPWLGSVPTYFNTFEDAQATGLGPVASAVMAGSLALGDVAITGALAEAATVSFRPRQSLRPGERIQNTQPIQRTLIQEKGITKTQSPSEYYSLPKTVAKKHGGTTGDTFFKVTPASDSTVELSIVQVRQGALPRGVDYVKNRFGVPDRSYTGSFGREIKIDAQIVPTTKRLVESTATAEQAPIILKQIPPKPLKGFERSFITKDQMTHLADISKVNGVESGMRDAVIRTVTGKKVMGELTQAEYVKSAQTLAKMNNMSKLTPEAPGMNAFSRYASPQRHWMRAYEEKGGLPVYSEVYVPMEEGIRLRNVFRSSYRNTAREIHGKYAKPGFGEERRLVKAYMEGDTKAITANPAIKMAVKKDLIKIAEEMRKQYDTVGPQLDVPTDIFLKDYQPHIQNIGGVYQLYKSDVTKIPKELDFFAKFKRHGNLDVSVDDSLALWDIYINGGSNKMFLNPVLEKTGKLMPQLPDTIHNSMKSYMLERMGYAGNLEKWFDNIGTGINKKLGTNLPPDAARQFTSLAMDTTYSGALGLNPGKAVRNLFQTDLMTYPRLGPKFYGAAARKALTKAAHKEVRERGFLVELGVPYGEELAKDITLGGRAGNTYRKITQGTLGPYSMADQTNRVRTYWQLKFQFEDAIAKYNKGKATWTQTEKALDLNSLGTANKNIVRERLVAGDMRGAFENMVREVLDETHFPYRRGASSRITYGLGGKFGTQFLQWPIEFIHTHAKWIKTGQFDKLIRFWGSSSAVSRSMKDAAGIDTTNFMFYNSLSNPNFSPLTRASIDSMEGLNALLQKNSEQLEENKEDLARFLQTLGVPAGAQAKSVKEFFKSYNAGPVGPNGEYGVYDQRGRLKYHATFPELWLDLWGFPSNKSEENKRLNKEIRNERFDFTQAKQDVLELYQQEKYDEANEIIQEFGIQVTPQDFDKYHIPQTQRTFKALPATLKAQFAPKIFPPQ